MKITFQFAKIKTGFSDYSNAGLATFVNGVITGITGNVNFPITLLMLPNLSELLAAFVSATSDAQNRDSVMIGIRNTARIQLIIQLVSVAASVTYEAGGDRDKLLSSNFELYKSGDGPAPALGQVTGFKVEDAELPIGLKLSCDGAKNCKSYMHQLTPDPLTADSKWETATSTSKEFTFANLPSGKKFWCRIMAIGTKGQVTISDPLSRITQ